MSKFGKFVAGVGILGAAAIGVYYMLDQDAKKKASETVTKGEEDSTGTAEEESTSFDEDQFRDAASRAYTTIKHGTEAAVDKMKESIGPKGEDVLKEVGNAAGKVKDTVVDSANRVRDILNSDDKTEPEETTETFMDEEEDETEEDKTSEETESSADEETSDEPEESETSDEEEMPAEEKEEQDETEETKTESFFDDSDKFES